MQYKKKRTIDWDLLPSEKQLGPKKPNMVKPFSQSASSFQPWQPSWMKGHGFSSNEGKKPYIHLTNSNCSVAQDNSKINIENSTLDHAENNPIKGSGATSGAGNDDNPAQIDEGQAEQPGSGGRIQLEMDPKKLKRIMANRASSQRSRQRQNEYTAHLEAKAKFYENKIALLHPQIVAYKNHQRLLMIEHHTLRLQMAAEERQRIIDEVEIEKNKAKVNRLSELHRKLIVEARSRMLNMSASMQLMANSNLNPSGFGRLIGLNSNQAQNGVGTSRVQTDISQQPQNQSTLDLNIVKSEPAD